MVLEFGFLGAADCSNISGLAVLGSWAKRGPLNGKLIEGQVQLRAKAESSEMSRVASERRTKCKRWAVRPLKRFAFTQ